MNAEAPGSEAAPQRPSRRWLKFTLISGAILLVGVLALHYLEAAPEQPLAWISPDQFTKATSSGPFARLKYKVKNLTAPLWQRFRRPRQQVLIEATFVEVPLALGEQGGLGPPTATNLDGTFAWIVSSSELAGLQKLLGETPEARQLGRPRISTLSGLQAGVFVGTSAPGAGGLGMDITATVVSPALRLLVKVQSTEKAETAPGNLPTLKTNLAVACRATLPNGGALVLMAGNPKDRSGTNHWLIFSPTAIDARGRPIKL